MLDTPEAADTTPPPTTFEKELQSLINCYSMESGSDTPDFLLAEFLVCQLRTWDQYVTRREQWYGRTSRFAGDRQLAP